MRPVVHISLYAIASQAIVEIKWSYRFIVIAMDHKGKVRAHFQCEQPVSNVLIEIAQYFGDMRRQCA